MNHAATNKHEICCIIFFYFLVRLLVAVHFRRLHAFLEAVLCLKSKLESLRDKSSITRQHLQRLFVICLFHLRTFIEKITAPSNNNCA